MDDHIKGIHDTLVLVAVFLFFIMVSTCESAQTFERIEGDLRTLIEEPTP